MATNDQDKPNSSLPERITRVEERVENLRSDVDQVYSVGKWILITICGAVLVAVVNWILGGGLNA